MTAIVITIHITMNGVPGPSQNNSHVAATPSSQALSKIRPNNNGTHTSLPTTRTTMPNIRNVFQSLMLTQSHFHGKAI